MIGSTDGETSLMSQVGLTLPRLDRAEKKSARRNPSLAAKQELFDH